MLARREHSAHELSVRLEARGHAPAAVAALLSALAEEGLQSDVRYAEQLARRRRARGHGPRRVEAELARAGVEAAVARSSLAEDGDWEAVARGALLRRFGAAPPGSAHDRAARARFLQNRGFTAEQVRRVVEAPDD